VITILPQGHGEFVFQDSLKYESRSFSLSNDMASEMAEIAEHALF
jgi:hypothetical protein